MSANYQNVCYLASFITVPNFRRISLSVPEKLDLTDGQTSDFIKVLFFLFRYGTLNIDNKWHYNRTNKHYEQSSVTFLIEIIVKL